MRRTPHLPTDDPGKATSVKETSPDQRMLNMMQSGWCSNSTLLASLDGALRMLNESSGLFDEVQPPQVELEARAVDMTHTRTISFENGLLPPAPPPAKFAPEPVDQEGQRSEDQQTLTDFRVQPNVEALTEQSIRLRSEVDDLRDRLAQNERLLQTALTNEQVWVKRHKEYQLLLEEKADSDHGLHERIRELQKGSARQNETRAELDKLKHEVKAWVTEIAGLRTANADLRTRLAHFDQVIARQDEARTAELNNVKQEAKAWQAANAELRAGLTRLDEGVARQDEKRTAELTSVKQEVKSWQAENADLRARLARINEDGVRQNEVRTAELNNFKQEVKSWQTEHADLRARLAGLDNGSSGQNEALSAELNSIKQAVKAWQADNVDVQARLARLDKGSSGQSEALTTQFNSFRHEVKTWQTDNADLRARLDENERLLQMTASSELARAEEIAGLRAEITRLRARSDQSAQAPSSAQVSASEQEVQTLLEEKTEVIRSLHEKIRELQEGLARQDVTRTAELNRFKNEAAAWAEEAASQRNQNAELRARFEQNEQMLQRAQTSEQAWAERQKVYKALLQEKADANSALHERIRELREAGPPRDEAEAEGLNKLKQELDERQSKLAADQQILTSEMQSMETSLVRDLAELERLRSDNRELHEKIRTLQAGSAGQIDVRAEELTQLKQELDERQRTLTEDEHTMSSQMRAMEISLSRDRADLARQRNDLLRLQTDIQRIIDMGPRDASLQERLASVTRRNISDSKRKCAPKTQQCIELPPLPEAPEPTAPSKKSSGFLRRIFGGG